MNCGASRSLEFLITQLEYRFVTIRKPLKSALLGVSLGGMLMVLPIAANATTVSSEIAVAAKHAGLSAESTTLWVAHMHLHHTLNCLVGPAGLGFSSKYFNPCAHLGHGAIPDSKNSKSALELKRIAAQVRMALNNSRLQSVKNDALRIEAELKRVN